MTPLVDPERALALAYAPIAARPALALLWRLDERLGAVLDKAHAPMIAAIRLAWWREALEALDTRPPPPEPLLREIAAELLPRGVSGGELAAIEAGWAALIEGGEPDAEAIIQHSRERGRTLFLLAARLLGGEDSRVADAGEAWALADVARRLDDPGEALALALVKRAALRSGRWPVALRPLGMLATLAGRVGRQGSPGRVARAAWHRLTGR